MVNVGDRHILSVDWDTRELRLVHARVRRNRVRVEDVFAVVVPPGLDVSNAEEMGRLLRDALQQERVGTRRVIVDVPREQAVLNTLSLPRASVSDLAGMVQVQIGKSLPFPIDEAVIDFAVPSAEEQGDAPTGDVLVGAVRKDALEYYRQVCHAAGLRLERIGLRPYANRVAVAKFLGDHPPERVLVVDLGPTLTEIDVLRRGQLVFSRSAEVYIPPEGSSVTSMEEAAAEKPSVHREDHVALLTSDADQGAPRNTAAVVADLMVEVTRSIEAYRTGDPAAPMDCAVVAGGTGIEETLADAIQRRFNINAETYNPAGILDGDKQRAAAATGFSAALGLVVGHGEEGRLQFNFLDPKRHEAPSRAKLRRAPLVAAVAALFVIAATVFYWQGPARKFARLAEIEAATDEVRDEIKAQEEFIELVDAAKEFEDQQVVWIDQLRTVIELLPDNRKIVLEKIDMNQADQRLVLDLRAADEEEAPEILKRFEKYRPDDSDEPYYSVTRSGNKTTTGDYPYEDTVRLVIERQAKEPKQDES